MSLRYLSVLLIAFALTGCDAVSPSGEPATHSAAPSADVLINGEVQLDLDRTATTALNSIYLVPQEGGLIRCTTNNVTPSGGVYRITAYNEDADTGDGLEHCDGLLAYNTEYLIFTGNALNGISFRLPPVGQGSGDFVASLSGSTWTVDYANGSSDATTVSRTVGFSFPEGTYTVSGFESDWIPSWTALGLSFPLPIDVNVDVDVTYMTSGGSTITRDMFNGRGGAASGTWASIGGTNAQGGSNGTLSVTDTRGNDTSQAGFTVEGGGTGGGGGGGPAKCFPGGINWPACQEGGA